MKTKGFIFTLLISAGFFSGCGKVIQIPKNTITTAATSSSLPGSSEPAARIIFHRDYITDISDFDVPRITASTCLGEVTKYFFADGDDYSGTPASFTTSSPTDYFLPTYKPSFLKHVAVDITNTYFVDTEVGVVQVEGCSYRGVGAAPTPSQCADFDDTIPASPLPLLASTPTPTPAPTYQTTGMYRVRDEHCEGQGPVIDPDPEVTKTFIGGVNIDLDRSSLGASEDLLMMLTYHAEVKDDTTWPANLGPATPMTSSMRIDLVGTSQGLDTILGIKQPRAWSYYNNVNYPVYMQEITTLDDPFGTLRTESVLIPLSQNSLIDRIRIERIRGSYILYQLDLYRLGNRADD